MLYFSYEISVTWLAIYCN